MTNISICPECGTPSLKVAQKTVARLTKADLPGSGKKKESWQLCVSPECSVVYFFKKQMLHISDLRVPVWFKDGGGTVPICYCGKLKRDDIKLAVKAGCTTIPQVLKHAKKKMTKKCDKTNPAGKCCKNALKHEIAKALSAGHSENT